MAAAQGRRRRGAVLGAAVVVLLLVIGWFGWQGEWFSSPTRVDGASATAAPEPTAESDPRRDGLDAVMAQRGDALVAYDRTAWLASADPQSPEFVAQQGQLFDQLGPVRFSRAQYEYAGQGPALSAAAGGRLGPQAWVAKVVFSYRIEGADDADVRREQYLTMVPRGGHWYVAGTSDGPAAGVQRDVWELGPVHAVRGKRCLVLGNSPDGLAQLAGMLDRAAVRVDDVWGTNWPRTVVAIVPRSQTDLAMLLGRTDEAGLDQIAAVTTGEVGLPVGEASDRVIVNPPGFGELGTDAERENILTHEVTHVATRAAGPGEVPTWFAEGFADYVAYSGQDYRNLSGVDSLLHSVAGGAPVPSLPTKEDFDPAQRDNVDQSYAAAHLAILYLDRTYSRDAVIQLYRAMAGAAGPDGAQSTPMPLAQALPATTGVELPAFEAQYQDYVRSLAQKGS